MTSTPSSPSASTNTSLTSLSATHAHVFDLGRRYHAYREGAYPLPDDAQEQQRLELLHAVFLSAAGGKLLHAPLPPPAARGPRVLDLGTGTGAWAIALGEARPDISVLGCDLSPIQPRWVPRNVGFEVDDCESAWAYGEEKFDLIHVRCLGGGIGDWPRLLGQACAHLEPGTGWIECQELEMSTQSAAAAAARAYPALASWQRLLRAASISAGREWDAAPRLARWVRDAGFVDVRQEIRSVPLGPHHPSPALKTLGQQALALIHESLEAYSLALFCRELGWSREEVGALVGGLRGELSRAEADGGVYVRAWFVWGRRGA
ncbi:uncharacterized protein K452DRAFT_239578 [Aplosporella prunicola CBS 121167]|uniref:Methyltransferase domain-containing protein n=1 Tax=Aplosporella prunicola CBS 121167 TaxID=1176127 RepID=A0A6A6AX09_9PEZI|nr:uncharacterized protein K452DRAFT_239578 [Aplosporella prunicola CBS 121167]KAF2135327.1 hypothetical protein K452DRAFT_239578 [Aplosporella prunicola CBS 121167]